ncbi:MAG: hypothetical protein EXX96DRAFT_576204 [Benjaminiella poitrasii]|nr:MAG: hypothetical protein EXX96DRAFT_576204 [Benjaminiella poitrasii]
MRENNLFFVFFFCFPWYITFIQDSDNNDIYSTRVVQLNIMNLSLETIKIHPSQVKYKETPLPYFTLSNILRKADRTREQDAVISILKVQFTVFPLIFPSTSNIILVSLALTKRSPCANIKKHTLIRKKENDRIWNKKKIH